MYVNNIIRESENSLSVNSGASQLACYGIS